MKKNVFLVLCVALLGMLLAACSTAESLDATSWGMTSYRDAQGNLVDILPDTIVTADFQADQVSGNVTCNNYSGAYQTNGNKNHDRSLGNHAERVSGTRRHHGARGCFSQCHGGRGPI